LLVICWIERPIFSRAASPCQTERQTERQTECRTDRSGVGEAGLAYVILDSAGLGVITLRYRGSR